MPFAGGSVAGNIFLRVVLIIALSELGTTLILDRVLHLPPGPSTYLLGLAVGIVLAGACLFFWAGDRSHGRQAAQEEARRHLRMQSALYKIARLSLGGMTLPELLGGVLDCLFSVEWLASPARGGVFLLDGAGTSLVLRVSRGVSPPVDLCASVALGECVCGRAALSGQVEFAAADDPGHRSRHPGVGEHSRYCVPIRAGERCLGVIQLLVPTGHRRDEKEVVFLETVGSLVALIVVHKSAEDELGRLVTALEQSSETVVITDPDGVIRYVNPAFTRTTGYSRAEALGQTPRMFKSGKHEPEFYAQLWRTISGGGVWRGRMTNKKKDGTLYDEDMTIAPVKDVSGQIVNYVAVRRDVTVEVALEGQLRQSQKMEALGLLAGGIAHDFNNVLTTIVGYNYFVLDGLEPSHPLRAFSQEIRRQAAMAASLTRQLLAMSRKQVVQPRVMDLNTVIMETAKMFRRLLDENIEFVLDTHPSLWPIKIDSGQAEQVILNLVINARDAMPKGGRLIVGTRNLTVGDDGHPEPKLALPAGHYVCLEIRDTGIGMDERTQARIFEPFFTTKEVGRGTGLGLATVMGIVKQYGGQVTVESEPGKGAAFRIYLPRTEGGAEAMVPGDIPESTRGGHETILLVEDHAKLRELFKKILRQKGYRVLSAADSTEAIMLCRRLKEPIHLLLTDLVLPDINGVELAVELTLMRPGLRVVYMSGYAGNLLTMGSGIKEAVLLEKPFSPGILLSTVRRLLDTIGAAKQ